MMLRRIEFLQTDLFNDFKVKNIGIKMTSAKFKEDVLNNSGITSKRFKTGVFFCGLRCKNDKDKTELDV